MVADQVKYFEEKNVKVDLEISDEQHSALCGSSFLPLMIKPTMTRVDFASFCLERLMKKPCPVEMSERVAVDKPAKSYFDIHRDYVSSSVQLNRLVLPDKLPEFSIDDFILTAPADVSLKALDNSLATGWAKRRDLVYSTDERRNKLQDIVPAEDLVKVNHTIIN